MRRRALILVAALALAACGCFGYLRPIACDDGEDVFLLLAAYRMDEPDPRTVVFVRQGAGWRRLPDRAGAVSAAAAWRGELWCFYPRTCMAMKLAGEDFSARVVAFEPGWPVQAAAVHEGDLWALGVQGDGLVMARRGPEDQSWQSVPLQPALGSAVLGLHAASSGGRLWVLWRKRAAAGELFPEAFSGSYSGGRWTLGPARQIAGHDFAVVPADGGGVLVAAQCPDENRRRLVLFRVDDSGWKRLQALDFRPREFGAALGAAGLLARRSSPDGRVAQLLVFAGARGAMVVREAELDAAGRPGAWSESARLDLDLTGPDVLLAVGLFLAAAAVGVGLGMIAARRTQIFPMPPGSPRPAPLLPRVAAWTLDNLLLGLAFYAVLAGFHLTLADVWRHGNILVMLLAADRALFFFYAWVFESRWGATPGKLALGLCVTTEEGARPSARAALVRNLLRVLDELLLCPLPGLVAMAATRRTQRLGDLLARTMVTTRRSLAEISEDRRRKSDRFGLPS